MSNLRLDLAFIRDLAYQATEPGPGKWNANTELLSWFRSDPVAVIEALQAAEEIRHKPGGLSHSRLYEALERLPRSAA